MLPDMMDAFSRWAVERGGYFTRAEAKDYGHSDSQIQAAVREGVWVRLRHGYYTPEEHVGTLDPNGRYQLLCRAVVHRLGPEYVLVGVSACAAHGIDLWDVDRSVVHVARIGGRKGRNEAGVRYHDFPFRPEADTTRVDGTLAIKPGLAVWAASCELSTEAALVCMNSALHTEVVSGAELMELSPSFTRWHGSRTARLAFRLTDPRVETVGESRTMFLCWEFHLPRPEPQFEIRNSCGELVARTDFAWQLYRHVCEFDGKVKYLRYLRPGESTSDAVVREKRREDLVRAERLGMSRLIWVDIDGDRRRGRTAISLRGGLEQSRSLYTNSRTILS